MDICCISEKELDCFDRIVKFGLGVIAVETLYIFYLRKKVEYIQRKKTEEK